MPILNNTVRHKCPEIGAHFPALKMATDKKNLHGKKHFHRVVLRHKIIDEQLQNSKY